MKTFILTRLDESSCYLLDEHHFITFDFLEYIFRRVSSKEIKLTISAAPFEGADKMEIYFGKEFIFVADTVGETHPKVFARAFAKEIKLLIPASLYFRESLYFSIDETE